MQPAAGMARIDEDRYFGTQNRRQRLGIVAMRNRRHRQHDQVGARNRLGDIGGQKLDGEQSVLHALGADAALLADRCQRVFPPRMQPNGKAPRAKIGRRRAAAMSCAQHRDFLNCH